MTGNFSVQRGLDQVNEVELNNATTRVVQVYDSQPEFL